LVSDIPAGDGKMVNFFYSVEFKMTNMTTAIAGSPEPALAEVEQPSRS
jgi:hypothetical protein